MGRKIPGRKHRGVKDPEKQQAERFAKIKDKINTAPLNPDEQQVPSSLSRLIELKNKAKQGFFDKKKKKKNKENKKENSNDVKSFKRKPEKHVPKFEQRPGESNREFKHRMNRICSEVIKEAAFENKYNIDIKRNEKGEVEGVTKRPKDELELLVKKLQKEKKSQKNKKGRKKKDTTDNEQKTKLTKSQKWALKKAQKRKRKESDKEQDYNFTPQKDQVKFGETVQAPPTLVAPKKAEKQQGAPRPGQKQLLLKSMLTNSQIAKTAKSVNKKENKKIGVSKASKSIDKKGKRKDLPHALRRQLDKQQKEIIEAYKTLKSKKHSS